VIEQKACRRSSESSMSLMRTSVISMADPSQAGSPMFP
jgi:hypothetical protein